MSILLRGVSSVPQYDEIFSLGVVGQECIEPFDLEADAVYVAHIEPFDLLGAVALTSVEPFMLGQGILVGSQEPFSILGSTDAMLGTVTPAPASPKLGWRDRTS